MSTKLYISIKITFKSFRFARNFSSRITKIKFCVCMCVSFGTSLCCVLKKNAAKFRKEVIGMPPVMHTEAKFCFSWKLTTF